MVFVSSRDGVGQREDGNSLRGLLVCDALIIRWGQMRKVLAGEAEDKCHLALFASTLTYP